jgi:hypothetical protein
MIKRETEKNSVWQKTPYANLVRYKTSGKYFARLRLRGKLIRRGLKATKRISVTQAAFGHFGKGRTSES